MENQQSQSYPQPQSPCSSLTQPQQPQIALQQTQIPGQQSFHHLLQQQQQQLQMFWNYQHQEIEQVNEFKTHQLPLARIKKIMKADEDVRMISAEAPVLFAKACELFILELTIRSWLHAEENKRRTLQKNDIAAAITRTDIFDFLVDIVPREELKEESLTGMQRTELPEVPYYYPPMGQQPTGAPVFGRPVMPMDPSMYMQQPRPEIQYGVPRQSWQQIWQPNQQQLSEEQQSFGGTGQENPDGQGYGVPPSVS